MSSESLFKGIVFDFDGTLTKPLSIDFQYIRRELDIPESSPILTSIELEKDPKVRIAKKERLNQMELEAAQHSLPSEGAEECVELLYKKKVPMVILSRNIKEAIFKSFKNFKKVDSGYFMRILDRDENFKFKPSPDGVIYAAQVMKLKVTEVLMVGDYIDDMISGQRAGAKTALIDDPPHRFVCKKAPDYQFENFLQFSKWIHKLLRD